MKIYCRLDGDVLAEIISIPDDADIADRFTPEIGEALVPGDESVEIGMIWDGEHFSTPTPPDPPATPPPTLDELIAALIKRNVIEPSDITSLPTSVKESPA